MTGSWLPIAMMACSLIPAVAILLLRENQATARNWLNYGGAAAKLTLVVWLMWDVAEGGVHRLEFPLGYGLDFVFSIDAMALLFVSLSALLWFVTTVYAIAYLSKDPSQRRFFGFFSLCVASTMGIAMAGNPMTFFIFYEMLTLSTYPLVAHSGDRVSLASARLYLRYTISGSAVLLLGIVWLESAAGPLSFADPTVLAGLAETSPEFLRLMFVLMVGGLAVKAAMVPVHGWLPAAMVAPAPVSALLHAVAVVKAGAFGILRVVFDLFGIELTAELGLGPPLAVAASATILIGSMIAVRQTEIKKRLAYSTVSQVSYIMLGISLLGPIGLIAGLVHLVHQGLMKITLFFCAGTLQKTLGIHSIRDLPGVGWRMPWTMLAFSVGAIGMMGTPPVAGFVTKWYLGLGALEAQMPWVLLVLAGSTLLNAVYFLPLIYSAWFKAPAPDAPWQDQTFTLGAEAPAGLVLPALFTAAGALGAGLLAGFGASPLEWATLVVEREYLGL